MIVKFDLPEIPEPSAELSGYWTRFIFVGSVSQDRDVNALASTYMRLVEASTIEFRSASLALRQVWSDTSSIQLRTLHRSISHFENCVTSAHRAIATYRQLRNHPTRDPLSAHLAQAKPAFNSDKVASAIRKVRDSVHHLDEKLREGDVPGGSYVALSPSGPELPHPSEAGQTIKTFDRLSIGSHELLFVDLAGWLTEMEGVAIRVAQFDPRSATPAK